MYRQSGFDDFQVPVFFKGRNKVVVQFIIGDDAIDLVGRAHLQHRRLGELCVVAEQVPLSGAGQHSALDINFINMKDADPVVRMHTVCAHEKLVGVELIQHVLGEHSLCGVEGGPDKPTDHQQFYVLVLLQQTSDIQIVGDDHNLQIAHGQQVGKLAGGGGGVQNDDVVVVDQLKRFFRNTLFFLHMQHEAPLVGRFKHVLFAVVNRMGPAVDTPNQTLLIQVPQIPPHCGGGSFESVAEDGKGNNILMIDKFGDFL